MPYGTLIVSSARSRLYLAQERLYPLDDWPHGVYGVHRLIKFKVIHITIIEIRLNEFEQWHEI
jgi:hypothetical protein